MREFNEREARAAADIEGADTAEDFQVVEQKRAKARAPKRSLVVDFAKARRGPSGRMVKEVPQEAAFPLRKLSVTLSAAAWPPSIVGRRSAPAGQIDRIL